MGRRRGPNPLSGLVARIRSLWQGVRRRSEIEADMAEEFRHHLELRTEDLIRRGLSPTEAARRARIEFGHVQTHKERARASRGLGVVDRIGFSWLDVKLGVRMLGKYPGLSLVSVIGMSVAIAVGAGGFGFIHSTTGAALPFDEGDRIVALQNSDLDRPGSPDRHALHDFVLWREELGSVRDVSAYMTDEVALTGQVSGTDVVLVARMSASGFRVPRVAPLRGRLLLGEDERGDAPPVVVIAFEEWQRRFAGDPEILGRTVELGGTRHTVVGVMPEGFRFPVRHRYWVPLRLDPTAYEVGGGPALTIFARLADGTTPDQAQAELTTIGARMAAEHPATHARLRPRVLPYTHAFAGIESPARALLLGTAQLALSLLLVVVAVNVAILVYARTVARMGEIAVRTALGASRRRVVTQLFAEALVLSLIAAGLGLTTVRLGFDWLLSVARRHGADQVPFWIDLSLSPALVGYVVGLAVVGGVIVGVLPALKVTGRAVRSGLQHLHSGNSGLRLGRTWTALVVVQVAVAVGALPYAVYVVAPSVARGLAEPSYPVDELLAARLSIEVDGAPVSTVTNLADDDARARFETGGIELLRRLAEEPTVSGVTFARHFPGSEQARGLEVEGGARTWAWVNEVEPGLLTVFDVPVLAGRGFTQSDATPGSSAVVVDRVFVDVILGGGVALGRHVRLLTGAANGAAGELEGGPWLEIVGVVPEFTLPPVFQPKAPKLYVPVLFPDSPGDVHLAVRTRRGEAAAAFAGRLREIATSVDPDLRLTGLETAADAELDRREPLLFLALLVLTLMGSVLLLSQAGIYAMTSFTVASRRREIGIRAALGAAPSRVVGTILRRAGGQLGAGGLVGLLLAEALARAGGASLYFGERPLILPVVGTLMTVVGLLAVLGPARRGLSVQPTEALRED